MFRCAACGQLSQPGEKATNIVTEKRERLYDFGNSKGTETVHEVKLHRKCAEEYGHIQVASVPVPKARRQTDSLQTIGGTK